MTHSPPTGELVARLREYGESGFATEHKTDCIEAAEAITTLERELEEARLQAAIIEGISNELDVELTASQAEVESLKAALKPFAEYMGDMDRDNLGNPLPDDAGVGWVYLTQADFRRARAALQVEESKG